MQCEIEVKISSNVPGCTTVPLLANAASEKKRRSLTLL